MFTHAALVIGAHVRKCLGQPKSNRSAESQTFNNFHVLQIAESEAERSYSGVPNHKLYLVTTEEALTAVLP